MITTDVGKMVYVFGKLIHNYRRWYRWCRQIRAGKQQSSIYSRISSNSNRKKKVHTISSLFSIALFVWILHVCCFAFFTHLLLLFIWSWILALISYVIVVVVTLLCWSLSSVLICYIIFDLLLLLLFSSSLWFVLTRRLYTFFLFSFYCYLGTKVSTTFY